MSWKKKRKKNGSVDRDFNVVVCLFVCFSTRTTQMHTLDVTKFDRQRCCVCTEKNLKKAKIADVLWELCTFCAFSARLSVFVFLCILSVNEKLPLLKVRHFKNHKRNLDNYITFRVSDFINYNTNTLLILNKHNLRPTACKTINTFGYWYRNQNCILITDTSMYSFGHFHILSLYNCFMSI